jgi:acyl-CoA synthetase (NDP forming)
MPLREIREIEKSGGIMNHDTTIKDIELLLNPKSIAIFGASEDFTKWGGMVLGSLLTHKYKGKIFPINPKYNEIKDIQCFANLTDIPEHVDMACIVVAKRFVLDAMKQCAEKGVRVVTIYAASYAEAGDVESQNKLVEYAKKVGIRILGPQSIGFINTNKNIATHSSLDWKPLVPGEIALITKSGGFSVLFDRAQERAISFSYLIHTGNEGDLDDSDFIRFFVEDPKTKVITIFSEGIKDPKKFIAVADEALGRKKPIIVYKVGRSEKGAKAALSHTGALSGEDLVYDAIFKQKGVIRVSQVDDLFNLASVFIKCKPPKGNRVGSVTVSGGGAGVLADKCDELGIPLPELSPKSKEELSKMMEYGTVSNPIDITGQATHVPDMYLRTLEIFIKDDNFDIIIPMIEQPRVDIRGAYSIEAAKNTDKPLIAWYLGRSDHPGLKTLEKSNIPVFQTAEECLRAIKAFTTYTQFLNEFNSSTGKIPEKRKILIDQEELKGMFRPGKKVLAWKECEKLFRLYDISSVRGEIAASPEGALKIANKFGFPVVLKAESPQIVHKTEAKALKVNLSNESQVIAAYHEIIDNAKKYNPNAEIKGVLVQEMVQGTEVIVGMSQDRQFGPTIIFGLGGMFVEVLKDISMGVTPLTKDDAEEMVRKIKGFQILKGYRGRQQADTDGIVDTLLKISALSMDLKDFIAEIDINPLFVFEHGKGVKASDFRVLLKGDRP